MSLLLSEQNLGLNEALAQLQSSWTIRFTASYSFSMEK